MSKRASGLTYFDNGGRTIDRYSAVMPDGDVLVMSPNPSHPQGVCTYLGVQAADGEEIAWNDLPDACKRQVIYELDTFYVEEVSP